MQIACGHARALFNVFLDSKVLSLACPFRKHHRIGTHDGSMSAPHHNTASEPLIHNGIGPPDGSREPHDDTDIDESHLVTPTLFISVLTACAGISGLLFGYEYVLKQTRTSNPHGRS